MGEIESESVVVCENEAEGNDRIVLPTNTSDNTLPLQTLKSVFPNAHGLKYKNPATGAYHALGMNLSGTSFCEPVGGWGNKIFVAITSQTSTTIARERPLSPMDFERVERIQKVIIEWEDRVFMINGEKGSQGSGVLISGQKILTAAHLSFKLHESYNIRGTNNRCFSAKCEFISKDDDFAMLKSTDLPDFGTPTGQLDRGNKYLMMGYPNGVAISKPSVTKGIIEGMMDDHIHLVGTPGSKRGYSGAPVFNYFGYLTGILLGGTSGLTVDTTIRECLDSSAEQKYARILGISSIATSYNLGRSNDES